MSERGLASRREADRLIEDGLVLVDGAIVSELGTRVHPHAKIILMPKAKAQLRSHVTILLNKPVGYVSNLPERGYPPAIELITPENQWGDEPFDKSHLKHLAVAGRLDIDSKGLLVFTQNGVIAKKLVGENSLVEKEYRVHVTGNLTPEVIQKLRYGLFLDDRPLKPAKVDLTGAGCLRFVLRQGRKRQIRRMCELVGLKVTGLKRVRVGKIRLDQLPEGKWRYLLPQEEF